MSRKYNTRQNDNLVKLFPSFLVLMQLELIADPYSDHMFFEKNDSAAKKEMSEM